MTRYSDNLWAEELGIDIDELHREHPLHPRQVRLKQIAMRESEAYWAKVNRYEFTDAQLQIARRSLDAQGSV